MPQNWRCSEHEVREAIRWRESPAPLHPSHRERPWNEETGLLGKERPLRPLRTVHLQYVAIHRTAARCLEVMAWLIARQTSIAGSVFARPATCSRQMIAWRARTAARNATTPTTPEVAVGTRTRGRENIEPPDRQSPEKGLRSHTLLRLPLRYLCQQRRTSILVLHARRDDRAVF